MLINTHTATDHFIFQPENGETTTKQESGLAFGTNLYSLGDGDRTVILGNVGTCGIGLTGI